jgi:two-component system NtrC family sensor kinase
MLRFDERLPLVYLDAARFVQVFVNLIENSEAAIASERSAGGLITITTHRDVNPDRIVIEVEDNGIGVRSEDLTRLFDPFFTTKGPTGRGLGLSICYGIVREHGGSIHARNGAAGGALFVVEIPVTAEAYIPQQTVAHAPLPVADVVVVTKKPRALVVDDEDSNAALVRRALDMAGYDVESTTLSRRALQMIERRPYDVVIADVKMPELSGQQLYARVCEIRPEMARRFIFVTGDIDGDDTLEFLERSQCGYFMKPFNLERLTTAVDMLVGGDPEGINRLS